jgi:exopolyphosphatase/guanosine-5'-triphosphate,3'-diphosphate pyrophosphatase
VKRNQGEADLARQREQREEWKDADPERGPDSKLRVGVLDLGSTSFHLLVADASPTGRIERVVRRRVMLRLGAMIAEEGEIPKPVAERAVETARMLRRVAEEHGVEQLLPVATAALRDASNGAPIAKAIATALSTRVRLLSGSEEAHLIFAAFRHRLRLGDDVALGMDLGGGSLELAIGDSDDVQWETTLRIGVARLHSEFVRNDPMKRRERKEIEARVMDALAACLKAIRSHHPPKVAIVSGGTARALARLIEEQGGGRPVRGGVRVTADEISEVAHALVEASHDERLDMAGIKASRADLLPTGAVILEALMESLSLRELLFCDWGLREGVILEALGLADGRRARR